MTHAKFSPSSASRWCKCPASLRFIEEQADLIKSYEAKKDNSSAEQGTLAHSLLESLLTRGEFNNANFYNPNDLEMVGHVKWAVEVIKNIMPSKPSLSDLFLVEKRVILTPEVFGTADCIIYNASEKILNIVDFKYGVHTVLAKENYQLGIYALGTMATLGIKPAKIVLHILQPRHMSGDRSWSSWTVDQDWLKELKQDVFKAVATVDYAEAKTGDHCRWCPAKPVCPAIAKEVTDAFNAVESDNLQLDDIVKIYAKRNLIEQWFQSVETMLLSKLESGDVIKGIFLKQGIKRLNYSKSLETTEIINKLVELGFEREKIVKTENKLLPLSVIREKIMLDKLIELGLVQETVTKASIHFGDMDVSLEFDVVKD